MAGTSAVEVAAAVLGERARRLVPVGPLTTYRVGGRAALFVRAESTDDLRLVGRAVAESALPAVVLGRGSNMLVADDGYAGLVVELGAFAAQIDVATATVTAGGGVLLPVLARRTAAAGLTGLEWMVGIPGSVGGAVRMNAGGHGSDMATVLAGVHIVDLASGEDYEVAPADLGLRFRGSDLGDRHVVVAARFELVPGDRAGSEAEIAEIVRWRREHQPGGQNCGSVFINPIPFELSAGQVIDELGLRGFRLGTAQVSEKHANFIQADEDGRAADVRAVMEAVRAAVLERRGIALRSEVRLVGFGDEDGAR
ncbi:MAG TPA: UDP-N-acetylmuramate dehydrogenase [Acidimicrobiales bacterium]